jgi:hypothetical protein
MTKTNIYDRFDIGGITMANNTIIKNTDVPAQVDQSMKNTNITENSTAVPTNAEPRSHFEPVDVRPTGVANEVIRTDTDHVNTPIPDDAPKRPEVVSRPFEAVVDGSTIESGTGNTKGVTPATVESPSVDE